MALSSFIKCEMCYKNVPISGKFLIRYMTECFCFFKYLRILIIKEKRKEKKKSDSEDGDPDHMRRMSYCKSVHVKH